MTVKAPCTGTTVEIGKAFVYPTLTRAKAIIDRNHASSGWIPIKYEIAKKEWETALAQL